MTNMGKEVTVWKKVLQAALAMPGVKVDREQFLKEKLGKYCDTKEKMDRIIRTAPLAELNETVIDRTAMACISSHTTKVTLLSAAAGMPGGFALWGTIPADVAQYYFHVLVLSQKLAYLYGFPSLTNKDGELTDDAVDALTVFVGVTLGVAAANEALNALVRRVAEQVAKRIPDMLLSKTAFYPIIKNVAKMIGMKLTKEAFGKGIAKVLPLIGAAASGGLTYMTFKPGAKRLTVKLKENRLLIQKAYIAQIEDAEYTEVE